ncbi:MAG: alpha-glucosidase [Terracidiphilus sp.]
MHWTRNTALVAAALLLSAATLTATAQATAAQSDSTPNTATSSERDWWKNAVIYEIYPRSFQDSNGDGIGDLNGITERLDYLKQLGIDAIWLSPCYPSPQADFGYDISDYENIDPQYGTLADFDRLVAEAKKRNIRIMMDMVMNHSSDEHKWFKESRSSRTNPYRDWYVWRDGKGETATDKGQPPNNWQSDFGGSAWEWDEKTRQYYYHKFYVKQPDFNWNNPKVHQAFKDIIGFWLKRGVVGFRFDAITTLFEDPTFADEDYLKDKDGKPVMMPDGLAKTDGLKTEFLPGVHTVMAEMRAYADTFSTSKFPGARVFIGETYLPSIDALAGEYGAPGKPEFQLPMDMQLGILNKMDAVAFRTKLVDVETKINGNVPLIVFDNHDNPRLDVRYGDGVHNTDIERVISTILFASRSASLFYYGDEIGMSTTPPTRKEDVKDPVGRAFWPIYKGRDGERTPMQWDSSKDAGFSTAASTWLPLAPDYTTVNVKSEEANPDSLLAWYEALIRLKKTNPALASGTETMLDPDNPNVLSWVRKGSDNLSVVVSVNFKPEPQTVSLSVPGPGATLKTLLKTPGGADPVSLQAIRLGPFGVYIGELRP